MKKLIVIIIAGIFCAAFIPSYKTGTEVPYPAGYRKWAHIKTAIIGPKNPHFKSYGGFHHIYANEKAMEGYVTGNYPEGSVIVFDVLEALEQKDGNTYEGKRKHVDVMFKDSSRYNTTGGWGYNQFPDDSKSANSSLTLQQNCFDCHATTKNYVFSTYRQ
jgi:hypothetical protein